MNVVLGVTVAIFMAGVVFHAGYLTARVTHLEQWRAEFLADFNFVRTSLARIEHFIEGKDG